MHVDSIIISTASLLETLVPKWYRIAQIFWLGTLTVIFSFYTNLKHIHFNLTTTLNLFQFLQGRKHLHKFICCYRKHLTIVITFNWIIERWFQIHSQGSCFWIKVKLPRSTWKRSPQHGTSHWYSIWSKFTENRTPYWTTPRDHRWSFWLRCICEILNWSGNYITSMF